jgi:predicted porin
MKKTQVALAALALVASTAALADGVKISGTLDAAVANTTTNQTSAIDGTGQTGTNSVGSYFSGAGGYVAGNNITISGDEDLGGGMKADFNLTKGFNLGNGADTNGGTATGFTQQANIGLSGGFGTLRAGLQLSPFIASYAGTGTSGNGHFFVNRLLSIGGGAAEFTRNGATAAPGNGSGGFFVPNSISYTSPSLSGFTIAALSTAKASGDGVLVDPLNTNSYQAYSLTGAIGSINTSVAYHQRTTVYSATSFSANAAVAPGLTAYANFMSVKYNAAVATMGDVKVGSYSLGLAYDATDALNVSLQYASNDIAGGKQSLTGFGAKYALSKRTFTYASLTSATNGASSSFDNRIGGTNALYNAAGGGALDSNRTIAVGVAHSF